jgi:hypothetical protein
MPFGNISFIIRRIGIPTRKTRIIKYRNVGAGLAPAHIEKRATEFVGAGLAPAQDIKRATARVAPTIGDIIGTFKSLCIQEWLRCIKEMNLNAIGKFWQRNFYEHIIRDEDELNAIRQYIIYNPMNWDTDTENPNYNNIVM